MKIYDLSKDLFAAEVYPGDPVPTKTPYYTISETCACNVTVLSVGSHNGTHMDAPKHFVAGAKDVAEMDLEKCVGPCKVILHSGPFTAKDAENAMADGTKRLLIRGTIELLSEAAAMFAKNGLWFLGVEHFTVGVPETSPEIHRVLLGAEIALLEAAVMTDVPAGEYFLSCAPLKMQGLDGSQCRPLLIEM